MSVMPRWVLILSALVMLSTCIPYAYHWAATPADRHFTGICEQTSDQNTYFMWARQVQGGRLLVYDLHTTEDHDPILPSLPWLTLGLVARLLPVPLPYLYHAFRLLLGFGYLVIIYLALCDFFEGERERACAFLIIALGSGFGALTDLLNYGAGRGSLFTADLMPELWAYHTVLVLPHFALALVTLAGLLLLLLRAYKRPTWGLALGAALCLALLTLVHPFTSAVIVPLLALHFVACRLIKPTGWRATWVNLVAILGFLPPAAFLAWQVRSSEIMRAWSAQNILPSPPALAYMLGFGIAFPLALVGLALVFRQDRRGSAQWLMALWAFLAAIMAYAGPLINFERRCVEGVHVAVAIFAAIGISGWALPWLHARLPRWSERALGVLCMCLLLAFLLPTNVKLLVDDAVSQEGVISMDWARAFEWLRLSTDEGARVMTSGRVGNFAARYAERRVHVGHRQQTLGFDRKLEAARRFFDPSTPDEERLRILIEARCEYVAADTEEAEVLRGWSELQEVFSSPGMTIYAFSGGGS